MIIQDAYRKDNSVIIQWDSEVSNILGFRVVYRLFGDKQFKVLHIHRKYFFTLLALTIGCNLKFCVYVHYNFHNSPICIRCQLGPPLASSEREFKIRNVPTQECIVVCVVSLEDINVTPEK